MQEEIYADPKIQIFQLEAQANSCSNTMMR
jgi:hypothetical protein